MAKIFHRWDGIPHANDVSVVLRVTGLPVPAVVLVATGLPVTEGGGVTGVIVGT